VLKVPFAVDDFPLFREELENAKRLLYIGDNAGEIVLDKVLIEELRWAVDCEVAFAVRGGPCINDALRKDAEGVGMREVARVVDTGSDGIGVPYPVYFILKDKCEAVARELRVRYGDVVFKRHP